MTKCALTLMISLNVLLFSFRKLQSRINWLQKNFFGKRNKRTYKSDFVILAQKRSKIAEQKHLEKLDFKWLIALLKKTKKNYLHIPLNCFVLVITIIITCDIWQLVYVTRHMSWHRTPSGLLNLPIVSLTLWFNTLTMVTEQ